MSELERAVTDLMTARLTLDKITASLNGSDFSERRSSLVSALGKQWGELQDSLAGAQEFLKNQVKEIELKEIDVGATKEMLQNMQEEVELKQEILLSGEKSLSKKIQELELRQEEVKKWLEIIDLEKCRIAERKKEVESDQRKVLKVDIVLKHRGKQLGQLHKAIKLQESKISGRMKEAEEREKEISRRMKEADEREKEISGRMKEVKERENEIIRRMEELEESENKNSEGLRSRVKERLENEMWEKRKRSRISS